MTEVILLGLNRSGTKLAGYLLAHALDLRRICFEPFTWEGGVDRDRPAGWPEQLRARRRSAAGLTEHRRLPVLCGGDEESPWLAGVLRDQRWDLVKLVEIGRAPLYRRLCPDALVAGLIRSPRSHLASLAGSTLQKDAVVEQWHRSQREAGVADPLPDANRWLPDDLADCARAYHSLYSRLRDTLPPDALRLSYDDLVEPGAWLGKLRARESRALDGPTHPPMIGVSTTRPLPEDQAGYLEEHLRPVYSAFLSGA